MKSAEIRRVFLQYFQQHGHTVVPSSSLVPLDDPTLLFTNAGMVQFKNAFLGEPRPYTRAASAQRCVRAGGKHNDLENVGYTARHHTFFEMLGNFSFGDYFKREAIQFAWDFLTKVLKVPPERLWVTVFEEDDEAAAIWLDELKVDPKRFSRCGEKDNFWAMGEIGPCGPCTEIFYDHGPEVPGGPPGSAEENGDRYVEIWNLVFMQFNREPSGKLKPLPAPSVDTGMGFERIAAVMQGVHNNYDIDIFQYLIQAIRKLAPQPEASLISLRVIADHIRSSAFLIADGVIPGNEGRGYVLRRIIRRAVRHGNKLGFKAPFFYQLVVPLIHEMGEAYPELSKTKASIEKILLREEQVFATTLEQGLKQLEQEIANLPGHVISGASVFRLYDTYGFPIDLTADIARERGLSIDEAGFHQEMENQRLRSQAASKFAVDYASQTGLEEITDFTGYALTEQPAEVVKILKDDEAVLSINAGDQAILILDQTPFYAEGGGQIGDRGVIETAQSRFIITDTQRSGNAVLHYGQLAQGSLKVNDHVSAKIDTTRRRATALNHSATHLLNAALRALLGEHVQQRGSLVAPERLRFDFSHFEPLHPEQLVAIERLVNEKIRQNLTVETKLMTPEEAMDSGAIALFGEKYGAEVRVLVMGDFSMELCGGTHVRHTGELGFFKIISETGIAAGIRRIEAVTGEYALVWVEGLEQQLRGMQRLVKASSIEDIPLRIENLQAQKREAEKKAEKLERELLQGGLKQNLENLRNHIELIKDVQDLERDIELLVYGGLKVDSKSLREMMDTLKGQMPKAVIVLGSVEDQKVLLVAGVSKDLCDRINASELLNFVAQKIDGKAGGRADMAQGGGQNVKALPVALKSVYDWVRQRVS
jgi:alanyl-tRNA synthetase